MRAKRRRRAGWRVMRGAGESMPSSFRYDRGRIGSPALSTKPNKLNSVIEWSDYNAVRFHRGTAPPRRKAEEYRNIMASRNRKSVVRGKRVAVRVDLGGRRLIKKK